MMRRRGFGMGGSGSFVVSVVLYATAVVVAPASLALAADPDELTRRGVEARKQGNDLEALRLFQEAHAIQRTPKTLAQIGTAEQALGRWMAADRHLREALEATSDPWIQRNRDTIESALRTVGQRLGRLDVVGSPPGAEVRVDGELVGQLPLPKPVRVTAGGVAIEVRAPGYLPILRAANVGVGELMRETFNLQPLSRAPDPSPIAGNPPPARDDGGGRRLATPPAPGIEPAPGRGPASDPAGAPLVSSGAPPPPRKDAEADAGAGSSGGAGAGRRALTFTAAGLSAAALVLGVVQHISWQDKVDAFGTTDECDITIPTRGSAACKALYDDGGSARTLAFVGYGAAAAFAAATAVLFFTDPGRSSSAGPLAACSPALLRPSLTCSFRF